MAGSIYKKLREQVFQAGSVGKKKKETICFLFCLLNPESAVRQSSNTPALGNVLVLFLSFSPAGSDFSPPPDPNLQTPTFLAPALLPRASPTFPALLKHTLRKVWLLPSSALLPRIIILWS